MAVDLRASRRTLPAPMLDRSSYSIFSVIKQAIGKDLTKFSIPVVWNEPLSFLQRLAESLEYSSLIDRAVLAPTPVERFHLLTAFVVSTLSTHLERMSKPFNPLLGETYEMKVQGDESFDYVAEQVSHHPPVSALFARGRFWTLSANVEPKVKFQGTNVVALSEGRWILRIKKGKQLSRSNSNSSFQSCAEDADDCQENDDDDEEEYTWRTPSVVVHNVIFGRLWCEFQGAIDLKQSQSNRHALLTIKSHSWFASQSIKTADMFKFTGFICEGKEKLSAFHGNYGHCYYAVDHLSDFQSKSSTRCSVGGHNCIHLNSNATMSTPCDLFLTPSSRLIWHRSLTSMSENELIHRHQYFYFTPFTMSLNELSSSSLTTLPNSDCRYRQDIRYLEKGDIENASTEKHRLEEKQRAEARDRSDDYQPLWFDKDRHGEFVYNGKYDQRKFDRCPNLFSISTSR